MHATFAPQPATVNVKVFDDMGHLNWNIDGPNGSGMYAAVTELITSLYGKYYKRMWFRGTNGPLPIYRRLRGVPQKSKHVMNTGYNVVIDWDLAEPGHGETN